MLEYVYTKYSVTVKLEGKKIGEIVNTPGVGWRYFPKGSKDGGEPFSNLADCKHSLESE